MHLQSVPVACPYCGETIELLVDASAGTTAYVEDCHVCCRPIEVQLNVDAAGHVDVAVRTDSA